MYVQQGTVMDKELYSVLEARLDRVHLQQRLGIEADSEARIFGRAFNFFHIENWYSIHHVLRGALRCIGLHARGQRNVLKLRVTHNDLVLRALPPAFDGFKILHISDLHLDMNAQMTPALIERVQDLDYDLCVLTGDFRAKTYGPYVAAVEAIQQLRMHLKGPVFGILGNHDSIRMVPGLEAAGVRMLLNESVQIKHAGEIIYLAGVDDAHYYRMADIDRAMRDIPREATAILLSHTPEIFRHAAHSGFAAMLSGHTHGGQICLPGGFPLMLNARCPRRFCAGAWRFHDMQGYTSVGSGASIVDVRFNCPPEVVVHSLRCAST